MSFQNVLANCSWEDTTRVIQNKTESDVRRALAATPPTIDDFMALISPAAIPSLEQMAHLSRHYTELRFGNTIQFYVPRYPTNADNNH